MRRGWHLVFERIRYRHHDASVFMWAFDLIERNGDDLRREPLERRKATLATMLSRAAPGLRLNDHIDDHDGAIVFEHACRLGLEGIVSKRKDPPTAAAARPTGFARRYCERRRALKD